MLVEENTNETLPESDEQHQHFIFEPIDLADVADNKREFSNDVLAHDSLNDDNIRNKLSKSVLAPDGGWGWMVVLGSFFTYFIASGLVYSFGIFYIEFLDFYKGGKSETAWIGSLVMGMMLLVGR